MGNAEIKMTEKESLELIATMINKAKNRVSETGTMYLFWGWLILLCCLVHFTALHFFNYPYAYLVWLSTWIVVIVQFFYFRKKKKFKKVTTYTGEINRFVWLVFLVSTLLIIFITIRFKRYELIDPLILVLYGMPTFLSGIILKFKPLIIGGICCWLLSVFSVFIPVEYHSLLIAAAVILAWIIPGYFLKKNFKKDNNNGF